MNKLFIFFILGPFFVSCSHSNDKRVPSSNDTINVLNLETQEVLLSSKEDNRKLRKLMRKVFKGESYDEIEFCYEGSMGSALKFLIETLEYSYNSKIRYDKFHTSGTIQARAEDHSLPISRCR